MPMAMPGQEVDNRGTDHCNGVDHSNGHHDPMLVDSSAFCISAPLPALSADPLNWKRTAKAMEGSHLDEVKSFIRTFSESTFVSLEGVSLTIAHVAAVARRPELQVRLDAATAKKLVDQSSDWALVQHALQTNKSDKQAASSTFNLIAAFEEELKVRLQTEVPQIREAYDNKGYSPVPNRIENCRTYPLYKFVRNGLKTQLLSGLRTISPGQEIEKVYDAICEGKHVAPLLECIGGWNGAPGPFSC
uniref:Phenylalanine ammonia-lyase n=1 Tax=Physcomitrium patens TaxID=3218 RepID=A0A2K1L8M6_PHYPA|nr:phenylalanine ammonia-lyase-like [Physcomitrium patens]PNR62389.1 hypothetical protein PHYPA_000813 [Physcomitrium patens]|eukprot:XP_024377682.1 phenylalanine ammonia-lyase-like [Physcomitrella patens]